MRLNILRRIIVLGIFAALPGVAAANDALNSGDTAWLMTSTALVLFMTIPGLALFYGGLVRARNVLSILVQCFAITCLVSVLWLVYVYSLAFSEGSPLLGGFGKVMMKGLTEDSMTGTVPESVYSMFQLTFAIITPALMIGGFAERMKFSAVMLFTVLWVTLVYAPIVHWVWSSGGWLFKMGLLDFAGGTVVHISAGVGALVAAMVLGKRRGFPETAMTPHNMTMTVTGAGMLWVGWFGFNAGSALAANGNAGLALMVTQISASAGAMSWIAMEWIRYGKPSALGIVTGMVAGLGTITPASGYVGPGGALVIGLAAGFVCFNATNFIKRGLHIDDSLDVFPVHGIGGILGTLLAGVFASASLGVFSGQGYASGVGMAHQLGVQVIGVIATLTYSAVATFIVLQIVKLVTGLRVSAEEESTGLDTSEYNERGYDL